MPTQKREKSGLTKYAIDRKLFGFHKVFGSPNLTELPEEFFVGDPLEIKNQDINYWSDFCASYGATAVSEDQEGVVLVPEYTFAQAKKLLIEKEEKAQGRKLTEEETIAIINEYGLNLADIADAAIQKGFLEREFDPFNCNTENRPPRDFIADYRNWSADLDMLANDHRKNSYFTVEDGPYDLFDNIRAAMYANRAEQRSILTGANWRGSWTSENGIIPKDYNVDERGSGHAFKVFGWLVMEDGQPWLVAQLSDGPKDGDKGLYYFPREVVNREFVFGAITFKDMPKDKAEYYHDNNINVKDNPFVALFKVFWTWFLEIFNINK